MTQSSAQPIKQSVAKIYLFTWNLNAKMPAHDLAIAHLALRGTDDLFIGCIQELPGGSPIAEARRATNASLTQASIAVVPVAAPLPLPRGLALVHHPQLTIQRIEADADGEFMAAIFQLPSSTKTLGIIGLHAKSKMDVHDAQSHGGSRALLRQTLNELRLKCDHLVVLGDWNSSFLDPEVLSWHCFYALSRGRRPLDQPAFRQRRGIDHPPFFVVEPRNAAQMGTFMFRDTSRNGLEPIDFIAVDEASFARSTSEILTSVAGRSVWDAASESPNVSDHLPVEGFLQI